MEAPPRFELGNKGFADLCLTTWLWRHTWWLDQESNQGHEDFQSSALPTELSSHITWQRPTLPHSLPCSTIGAVELNFPVRNGKECFLYAIITRFFYYLFSECSLKIAHEFFHTLFWSSPRPISISQLNMLPHLHL